MVRIAAYSSAHRQWKAASAKLPQGCDGNHSSSPAICGKDVSIETRGCWCQCFVSYLRSAARHSFHRGTSAPCHAPVLLSITIHLHLCTLHTIDLRIVHFCSHIHTFNYTYTGGPRTTRELSTEHGTDSVCHALSPPCWVTAPPHDRFSHGAAATLAHEHKMYGTAVLSHQHRRRCSCKAHALSI